MARVTAFRGSGHLIRVNKTQKFGMSFAVSRSLLPVPLVGDMEERRRTGDPMLSLATEASELLKQRRYTESRAAYLRLSNLPLFADQGYLGLGLVALRIGDPHAARWYFLHALRCNPGYAAAHIALEQLERSQPRTAVGKRPGQLEQPDNTPPFNAATPRGGVPVAAAWPGVPDPGRTTGTTSGPPIDLGSYEHLRSDTSLLAQHVTTALTRLPGPRPSSLLAHSGQLIRLAATLGALATTAHFAGRALDVDLPAPALWTAGALIWTGAALRIRTTMLDLSGGRLTIRRGLLLRRVSQLELSEVRSIERRHTLLDRLTGHGELLFTADTADLQVLRVRGLARKFRLRMLHASLSDLVFLLRSCQPQAGPAGPAGQPGAGWPAADAKPAAGPKLANDARATSSQATLPRRRDAAAAAMNAP
jgi:hypothetical protein